MSYSFVNRPHVKIDIINATTYYKKINPQLAKDFIYRLRESKEYVARSPFGFQQKYDQARTLLLKQFPYHIHYLIDEKNKLIIILAIIHAYKKPSDYLGR